MTELEMAQRQLQLAIEFVENSRQQLIRAEQHKAKMLRKVNELRVSHLSAPAFPR